MEKAAGHVEHNPKNGWKAVPDDHQAANSVRNDFLGVLYEIGERPMAYHGKIQITLIIIVPPDQVAEGDRIFKSHGSWMESTHYRTGEKALLSYNVSKGPELSNLDPNSAPTGNTCFVLTEIYESQAGVLDHMKQAHENWGDYPAFQEWLAKCKVTPVLAASIFNSLW